VPWRIRQMIAATVRFRCLRLGPLFGNACSSAQTSVSSLSSLIANDMIEPAKVENLSRYAFIDATP
jgi:hypothetical protein